VRPETTHGTALSSLRSSFTRSAVHAGDGVVDMATEGGERSDSAAEHHRAGTRVAAHNQYDNVSRADADLPMTAHSTARLFASL